MANQINNGKATVPELEALRSENIDGSSYGSTNIAKQSGVSDGDSYLLKLGLAAKLVYFLRFGQQGVFYTYIALYLSQNLGLSIIHCSVVFTVMMLAQSIGSNAIPPLADKVKLHAVVAAVSHLGGSAIALMLLFLGKGSFVGSALILGASNILIGGAQPLTDAAVFQICKKHAFNFGAQRLWGCLGWGIFAQLVACLVYSDSLIVMWYVYAAVAPFTVVVMYWLLSLVYTPVDAPAKDSTPQSATPQNLANFWEFLLHPVVLPFLASVCVMGALFGSSSVLWMSLWAVEDLHASYLVLGVSALVLNISEIPMFFYAADLGKRFGVHGVLYISSFAYAFWLLCYGYLVTNAWWIVVFQPLHGVAFAMQIGNLGTFTTKMANEVGFSAPSAQGFQQGALALGRAIGFICAGILYEVYSAEIMFRVMGFCSIFMFLAVACLHVIGRRSGNIEILYLR